MEKVTKLRFRKNGFIIEFEKNNGYLFFYIFRKSASLIIDLMFYALLLGIFIYVLNLSLIKSFIIAYFFFLMYLIGFINLFKNKTPGMLLASLTYGSMDGNLISKGKLINRALGMSIYCIPFIGQILMFCSLLSMVLLKGMTPIDLFTKTQTFNKYYHINIIKIYQNLERN